MKLNVMDSAGAMLTGEGPPAGNGSGNKMNMRINIFENLLDSMANDGTTAKGNALRQAIMRSKADMPETAEKSLDAMRRIFQNKITAEIREIIDRHLRSTFSLAFENLRRNGHDVGSFEMDTLCRKILDAAKDSYGGAVVGRKRPLMYENEMETDEETVALKRPCQESDDSDVSNFSASCTVGTGGEKRRRRPRGKKDEEAVMNEASAISMKEALKWNPERFISTTRFLFASRLASTLTMPTSLFFSKYPRFYRYVCEEEDKKELCDSGQLSRLSGRAILIALEDAIEITGHSPELERYSFLVSDAVRERLRIRAQRVYQHLWTSATKASCFYQTVNSF